MAATSGCNFLMSRSCLVPINRAMTPSIILLKSMEGSPSPDGGFTGLRLRLLQPYLTEHFIVTCWMRRRQETQRGMAPQRSPREWVSDDLHQIRRAIAQVFDGDPAFRFVGSGRGQHTVAAVAAFTLGEIHSFVR